ncbi:MAG: SEL1-like repeat protein [Pseudomonadota bacterium]
MQVRMLAAMALLCAFSATTRAQDTSQTTFPGWAPSPRMVGIQEKAEAAFDSGDYRKAIWIYGKELAPKGDKYAQYMVGHMHENGLGVPRDPVEAGAWYSLAAERGHKQLVSAADALRGALDPGQLAAAADRAAWLKARWGDKELVRRAIKRDYEILRAMAGTRIRPSSRRNCGGRPGRIFVGAISVSFDEFCESVYERIDRRFAYLEGYVTYGELVLLPDEQDEASENDPSSDEE